MKTPGVILACAILAAGCGEAVPAAQAPAVARGERERLADAVARAKERENAGDLRGAEVAWEEVLSLRPGHASALYATARLRRARGDPAGALDRVAALLAAEPNAGRGHLLAAEIRADPGSGALRDLARAEEGARAALERNPEESGPHLALGRVLLLRGRAGEAAARLEVAARMNPRDADSRSLLGVLHLRAGRPGEARRWFRAALLGGRPAGAAAVHGAVPGEGDTAASLEPARPPSAGELRAVAGLAALAEPVTGVREDGPCPGGLRSDAVSALAARGTGEALLDRDGNGVPEAAAVETPGAGILVAVDAGRGAVTVFR